LLDLFVAMGNSELSAVQVQQVELIRKSVRAREPGGGHLTELVRLRARMSSESFDDDEEEEMDLTS
jgi:hypothetical protein